MMERPDLHKRRAQLSESRQELLEQRLRGRLAGRGRAQTTIPRRASTGPVPLSSAQKRLWFLEQLSPDSSDFNVSNALRLDAALDPRAVRASLETMIQRHESLRTVFDLVDGVPAQIVRPAMPAPLASHDLAGLPPEARAQAADELLRRETRRPFDLAAGPLFRVVLIEEAPQRQIVLMSMHHIISDGWSWGVFMGEFLALYSAARSGARPSLPELPVQYPDVALWQQEWLRGEEAARQLRYWTERMADAPPLELPLDRPRRAGAARRRWHPLALPRPLALALDTLSRQSGVTLFTTLLAGFKLLLARYSGQTDLTVGTLVANRRLAEVEPLIGCFINMVALRSDLGGSPTVRELLQRVQATALGAFANQELPVEKLAEALDPQRDPSEINLFQTLFVLQNAPEPTVNFVGISGTVLEVDKWHTQFDLTCDLTEREGEISGALEYNVDLFERATIERMLEDFQALLGGMAADPDRRVGALALARRAEPRVSGAAAPPTELLPVLFAAQAARAPDATAVEGPRGRLSYRELNERANQLAHALRRRGIGPGAVVGVMLERSPEAVVGLLGVLKAGAVYLPLDPDYPAERLALILEDAEPALVLCTGGGLPAETGAAWPTLDLLAERDALAALPAENPAASPLPLHPAYMIYTSGSTGRPKGVLIPHQAIAEHCRAFQRACGLGPADRVLQFCSLNFDTSLEEILPTLASGAALVLRDAELWDAHACHARLAELAISVLDIPTAYWHELAQVWSAQPDLADLPALRLVMVGGEALLSRHVARWQQGPLGRVRLINSYGPTETTITATLHEVGPLGPDAPAYVPLGLALPGRDAYVLDRDLQPVPPGGVGELYLGGTGLALGYHRRPDLTAERFVPNPFGDQGRTTNDETGVGASLPSSLGDRESRSGDAPGAGAGSPSSFVLRPSSARLYRTGDRVRCRPDGVLEFLGRIDAQVKVRGFRVEPGEVETLLLQHPAVREAVVVGQPDPSGQTQLVAYAQPLPYAQIPAELRAAVEQADQQVEQWQSVYEELYHESDALPDPTFNTSGWNSSYTDEPLPAETMRELVERTVERIGALGPRRVLEIGSGMGLLLFRLAPRCERYVGLDFSARAVAYVKHLLRTRDLPQVEVVQGRADELAGLEPGSFDTVVLNSIAQHFPSIDYLLLVLERVEPLLAPGGRIFIGEVRSLPLLEAFHTSVELERAPDRTTVDDLRQRVRQRLEQELELAIDPAFFAALRGRLPRLSDARVQLKPGRIQSELNRFRYDVLLLFDGPPPQASPAPLDWRAHRPAPARLSELAAASAGPLRIAGVPNPRLAGLARALAWLAQADPRATLADLRAALRAAPPDQTVEPEDLWALERQLGRRVEITWAAGSIAEYEVLLSPPGAPAALTPAPEAGQTRDWSLLANSPVEALFQRRLAPLLIDFLRARLPAYMVPAALLTLDRLPLTPNGKIDRGLLLRSGVPVPAEERPVAPRTPSEQILSLLWQELLGRPVPSVHANFFHLGGHSLLATRLLVRIREAFGQSVQLRTLFAHPTLADLAAHLDSEQPAAPERPALPALTPDPQSLHEPFPLTDLQQAYWIGQTDLFPLGQIVGHSYEEMELPLSAIDLPRLERAITALVARHPALRIVVRPDGRQQVLPEAPPFRLELADLRGLPEPERAARLAELRADMVENGPPTDTWPLFHLRGHLLPDDRLRLHLSISLIIADGWSVRLFVRDIMRLYAEAGSLPPPQACSYRDYVLALQALRDTPAYQHDLAYWQARLPDLPPAPQLPLLRDPAGLRRASFVRRSLRLPAAQWSLLQQRGARLGLTPNGLLCAVYAQVLAAWSQQPHFTLNLLMAQRLPLHPDVDDLLGNCSTTLLLEVDLRAGRSFADHARALQRQLWADLEHPLVSGIAVVREQARLHGRHDQLSTPVVFASMIGVGKAPPQNDAGLRSESIFNSLQTPQVYLDHQVYDDPRTGGLLLNWDAVELLFAPGVLDAMVAAYQGLLERLAQDEAAWQGGPPPLAPAADLAVRAARNASDAALPLAPLQAPFFAQALAHPEREALVTSARRLSYAELARRSSALAHWLREQGARPNTLVAVVMEKGWEQVVAVMGVLASGAAYLPIDPHLPEARRDYLLGHAQATIALTQPHLAERLSWPAGLCVHAIEAAEPPETAPPAPAAGLDDLAYVIYTSGSTGLPKGVMITHRAAANTVLDINRRFAVGPDDRVLGLSSLSFDLSVYDVFGVLGAGGALVLPDPGTSRDPQHWADLLVRERVTLWNSVPALLDLLLEALRADPDWRAPDLRLAMLSGDWIGLGLPERLWARLPQTRLVSLGGATEAAIWSIWYPVTLVDPAWRSIPYGWPLSNQRWAVRDAHGRDCPAWAVGELWIGGAGVAQGYWRDAERSAAQFVRDADGQTWYRTGDLGRYWPDGTIEFLGRADFQVKIQGYRIELGEIEAALREAPAVEEAVVAVREDRPGEKRLVAYVVCADERPTTNDQRPTAGSDEGAGGRRPTADADERAGSALAGDAALSSFVLRPSSFVEELRARLQARLPAYMVPAAIVPLERLPLTANGKIDRRGLPAPEAPRSAAQDGGALEGLAAVLGAVWADVLGLEQVGPDAEFFSLGGTSISAVRLVAALRQRFEADLPLTFVFEASTLAQQAALLRAPEPAALT